MIAIPKILENVREDILISAEKILKTKGYSAMSVRKVARDCRIAVGTIYNYFSGKDELAANIILKDWRDAISGMQRISAEADSFTEGAAGFYRAIADFSGIYQDIWEQVAKLSGSHEAIRVHHAELRGQVEAALEQLIANTHQERLAKSVPILAEMIIAAVNQPDMDENTVRDFAALL